MIIIQQSSHGDTNCVWSKVLRLWRVQHTTVAFTSSFLFHHRGWTDHLNRHKWSRICQANDTVLKDCSCRWVACSEPQRLCNACMYMSWRCIKVCACQWDLWLLTHMCVCGVEDSREGWNQNNFHLGMGSCDVLEAHIHPFYSIMQTLSKLMS